VAGDRRRSLPAAAMCQLFFLSRCGTNVLQFESGNWFLVVRPLWGSCLLLLLLSPAQCSSRRRELTITHWQMHRSRAGSPWEKQPEWKSTSTRGAAAPEMSPPKNHHGKHFQQNADANFSVRPNKRPNSFPPLTMSTEGPVSSKTGLNERTSWPPSS